MQPFGDVSALDGVSARLNHRHQFVVVGRVDRRPRGRVKMADVGLVQFLPGLGYGRDAVGQQRQVTAWTQDGRDLVECGLWLHPMKRLGEHNEIERPPGRRQSSNVACSGGIPLSAATRAMRGSGSTADVCARLDHRRRRDACSRADVERSRMAEPDQLCDERPGVAGSVTVVVVGSEPKRLRPPPVGIRTWSPRHTPIMRRELGWVAHDVLGSCLQ